MIFNIAAAFSLSFLIVSVSRLGGPYAGLYSFFWPVPTSSRMAHFRVISVIIFQGKCAFKCVLYDK